MKVALFVPCFVDQFYPRVAIAAVKVLRRIGHEVVFPPDQTCCGQPAFNTGYWDEARRLALRFVEIFDAAQCESIVSLSGSCAAMVRNFYAELLTKPAHVEKLKRVAGNTFEFSEFLVERIGVTNVGASFPAKVTFHDSCHQLRELRIYDAPRILLAGVRDLELVEMQETETCCGFGGTFSVKFPMISTAMGETKIERIIETGAPYVVSNDSSCLMHIQGLLDRKKIPVKCLHLAEILASEAGTELVTTT